MKTHYIIGGGTIFHVRPHLALCAPAYGEVARLIQELLGGWYLPDDRIQLHLTRMAYGYQPTAPSPLETNADIARLADEIVADPNAGIVFMSAALCDFEGSVLGRMGDDGTQIETRSGKDQPRLKTSGGHKTMILTPADKNPGTVPQR